MQTFELNRLLSENTYPGRGIVLGMDDRGEHAVIVYFIMGEPDFNTPQTIKDATVSVIATNNPLCYQSLVT